MPDLHVAPDSLFLEFQTTLAGHYSIDRELGRGGMGIVYLAREVHLDRLVAIKLLPPSRAADPDCRSRFLREARLAASLSHPHIIPIHAVKETDGFVYFVMAYVDGMTLGQRVATRGPLSASDATRLLREVAWALGHAHANGLVHRDVKPDNVLIETATGRALVADFGIAAASDDATSEGNCGTPEFMSPEQALGTVVDARSDLYSLGATAFYALSGRVPYDGPNATTVLAQHVAGETPSLASTGLAVPRKLAALVERCLAKDPASRPATAQVFAEQLGLATEQRRELPVALRAFVKRDGRMDGGGTLAGLAGALITSVVTSSVTSDATGILVLVAGIALMPVVFGIASAKRLLDLGFKREDLRPAFRAEQENSREERGVHGSFAQQRPTRRAFNFSLRSTLERMLGRVASVSTSVGIVLVPCALARAEVLPHRYGSSLIYAMFGPFGTLIFSAFAVAAVSSFCYVLLKQFRRDVDVEFWAAMWTGRPGKLAFAAARRLPGKRVAAPTMTHRATELSLGLAAEQLFESLPKVSRDALGDLPSLLERLQRDAHALRARYGQLQEVLALSSAEASPDIESLQQERALVQQRLQSSVAALETIRLNLLRLHAGSISLERLTTHVDLAADASRDVERLLEAQLEVEATLRLPQRLALTPA